MFVIYENKICIVSIFLDIKAKGFFMWFNARSYFRRHSFLRQLCSSKSIQRAWTANPADDKCTNPMDDKSTNPNVSRQTINPELVRTRYVGSPIGHRDHFCSTVFPSQSFSLRLNKKGGGFRNKSYSWIFNYSFLNSQVGFVCFLIYKKNRTCAPHIWTVSTHFMIFTLSFAVEINVQPSLGRLPPHQLEISCRIS